MLTPTPYTPMLSRDGSCLLMPNGTFERLESLPRYQPGTTAQATPAPTAAPTPAPTVAPVATTPTKPASKE